MRSAAALKLKGVPLHPRPRAGTADARHERSAPCIAVLTHETCARPARMPRRRRGACDRHTRPARALAHCAAAPHPGRQPDGASRTSGARDVRRRRAARHGARALGRVLANAAARQQRARRGLRAGAVGLAGPHRGDARRRAQRRRRSTGCALCLAPLLVPAQRGQRYALNATPAGAAAATSPPTTTSATSCSS